MAMVIEAPKTDADLDGLLDTLFSIDVQHMEREWGEQPKKFARFMFAAAKANNARMNAKLAWKYCAAAAQRRFRIDGIPGIERVTEASIDMAVTLDTAVQETQAALIEAEFQVEVLNGLTTACQMRSSSLIRLHELYLQQVDPRELDREAKLELRRLRQSAEQRKGAA
jgi:hypothetical protein